MVIRKITSKIQWQLAQTSKSRNKKLVLEPHRHSFVVITAQVLPQLHFPNSRCFNFPHQSQAHVSVLQSICKFKILTRCLQHSGHLMEIKS